MFIYYLILLLSISCHGQETPATTTPYNTFTNNITTTSIENSLRTTTLPMPTSLPTTVSDNITMTLTTTTNENATSGATMTTSFSPSPTSFVFTHFPVFPVHTGSSSSAMSSARPSQSAPLPDDTIGKYGRLHISNATHTIPRYYSLCFFLFLFYFI